ncbi:MAG TPA: indole-3-glycerol phosphate synthase TrpC [Anaerolineales bacterium]|nr:indole-3-glycerol phosphate synthase TrpC [Anaerolineales bacterium]
MTILDEIFTQKRFEIARKKQVKSAAEVQAEAERARPPMDFVAALRRGSLLSVHRPKPALIAEIKRASPSKGLLRADFNPIDLARLYRQNGASAVSVLTDERYFRGHLDHLRWVAREFMESGPRLPLLRKDFICEPYQVYESRAAGADAILLIAAHLEADRLQKLHALSLSLGMAPLVEVHNQAEVVEALRCDPILMGINNRDLQDFSVNLETTLRLRRLVPAGICLVAESGIRSREDVEILSSAQVDAILVGEAIVTAADVPGMVRHFSGLETSVESP